MPWIIWAEEPTVGPTAVNTRIPTAGIGVGVAFRAQATLTGGAPKVSSGGKISETLAADVHVVVR